MEAQNTNTLWQDVMLTVWRTGVLRTECGESDPCAAAASRQFGLIDVQLLSVIRNQC